MNVILFCVLFRFTDLALAISENFISITNSKINYWTVECVFIGNIYNNFFLLNW